MCIRDRVHSESEEVLSLEFADADKVRDFSGPTRILNIVAPPAGITPEQVVASIEFSLFDTEIVSDHDGAIGGMDSRLLRLQTLEGTSHLGFEVSSGIYLEANGTDRSFAVHISETEDGLLVFWIEAPRGEIDNFEQAADNLIRSFISN